MEIAIDTTEKIKARREGKAEIFRVYIDYLVHLAEENLKRDNPYDIVNKYKVVDNKKLHDYYLNKYGYDRRTNIKGKKLVHAAANQMGQPEIEKIFAGDFGEIFFTDIIYTNCYKNDLEPEYCYKKYMADNFEVLRLECLRKGISIRKSTEKDNTRKEQEEFCMWSFEFRLKPNIQDKMLCFMHGIKFGSIKYAANEEANWILEEGSSAKELLERIGLMSYSDMLSNNMRSIIESIEARERENDKVKEIQQSKTESAFETLFDKERKPTKKKGISLKKEDYQCYLDIPENDLMPDRWYEQHGFKK